LPQSQLTFESALSAYQDGRVDFGTLLDAQRQIRKTRLDLLRVQLEQQMRLAEIERIVGEDLMNGKTVAAVTATVAACARRRLLRRSARHADGIEGRLLPANGVVGACGEAKSGERKLLYYRNPMGLPDTSPTPKKDPMGMDYVPCTEARTGRTGHRQGFGRPDPDARRAHRTREQAVPGAGRACRRTIEINERGQHTVAPKFEDGSRSCT